MLKKHLCSAVLLFSALPVMASGPSYNYFQYAGIRVDDTLFDTHGYIHDVTLGFAPGDKSFYELSIGSAVKGSEYLMLVGGLKRDSSSGQSVYASLGAMVSSSAAAIAEVGGRVKLEDRVELNANLALFRNVYEFGTQVAAGARAFITDHFSVGLELAIFDNDIRETWLSFRVSESEQPNPWERLYGR